MALYGPCLQSFVPIAGKVMEESLPDLFQDGFKELKDKIIDPTLNRYSTLNSTMAFLFTFFRTVNTVGCPCINTGVPSFLLSYEGDRETGAPHWSEWVGPFPQGKMQKR